MTTLNTRVLAAMTLCLSVSLWLSATATAQVGCPDDRPCFSGSGQDGNKVVFRFNVIRNWAFYNVRYAVAGGEKQVENRSGTFTLNNVTPRRVYTLKVQGCNKPTFGRSSCSPWVVESVTTR